MAQLINVADVQIGWRQILQTILDVGDNTSPRGLRTKEIPNFTIVHHRPQDCLLVGVGRKLSTGLAALEALQLVGGFSDPELTVKVAPPYSQFRDGDSFHGAYGVRTGQQVERVIERLQEDNETRRAVLTFWNAGDDLLGPEWLHDYPCTLSATFRLRQIGYHHQGVLDMSVVMRSNDAWLGYPYDIVQFSALQRSIAAFLRVPTGTYTHTAQSMHLYERDWDAVREILASPLSVDGRPELFGGIGTFNDKTWASVQARAIRLVRDPIAFQPGSIEEMWMRDVAMKAWGS
jgi:thymidylate synthase